VQTVHDAAQPSRLLWVAGDEHVIPLQAAHLRGSLEQRPPKTHHRLAHSLVLRGVPQRSITGQQMHTITVAVTAVAASITLPLPLPLNCGGGRRYRRSTGWLRRHGNDGMVLEETVVGLQLWIEHAPQLRLEHSLVDVPRAALFLQAVVAGNLERNVRCLASQSPAKGKCKA